MMTEPGSRIIVAIVATAYYDNKKISGSIEKQQWLIYRRRAAEVAMRRVTGNAKKKDDDL